MPLERVSPDPTRGDPGNECHKIEAPASVPADALLAALSPEKVLALRALSAGQTVREAAKSSRVSRGTVYNWLKHDPHFRAAFNAWKEELVESSRARLLKGADAAVTAVLKAVAQGDTRAALALLKGFGLLAPPPSGLTDPAMVNRQMELDRRQQRVELAARSNDIADQERKRFSLLHYLADEEETRQRRQRMEQANKAAAEKKAEEK